MFLTQFPGLHLNNLPIDILQSALTVAKKQLAPDPEIYVKNNYESSKKTIPITKRSYDPFAIQSPCAGLLIKNRSLLNPPVNCSILNWDII